MRRVEPQPTTPTPAESFCSWLDLRFAGSIGRFLRLQPGEDLQRFSAQDIDPLVKLLAPHCGNGQVVSPGVEPHGLQVVCGTCIRAVNVNLRRLRISCQSDFSLICGVRQATGIK